MTSHTSTDQAADAGEIARGNQVHPESPESPESAGAPHRIDPSGSCPHASNAQLRDRAAAVPVTLAQDVPGFLITRHQELKEFVSHPDVAKNVCHFAALQRGEIPEGWPLRAFATVSGMTTADGADHRRLRGLVTKAFTARRVETLRPRILDLTENLLDDLVAAAADGADGEDTVDLRRHFAFPLPMNVICELLGIETGIRGRLHTLTDRLVSTDTDPETLVSSQQELMAILAQVVEEHAQQPGDDLTSALVAAQEHEDRLSPEEVVGMLLTLIIAGHETTLNLISNAVRALCAHPEQLELLQSGEVSWADAVEETLRFDSPIGHFPFRYPIRDLEVDGTVIPQGTPVLVSYASAGRDSRAHGPDADRFDLQRPDVGRHLSLGYGAHFCIGASLARMEAGIALERLFTRFPELTVAMPDTELPRHPTFVSNGIRALPVRLGRPA